MGQEATTARVLKVAIGEVESMACWVQCRVWGTVVAVAVREGDKCRSRRVN